MKKLFIRRKTRQLLRKRAAEPSIGYDSAQRFGLLLTEEQQMLPGFKDLVAVLQDEGKAVKTLIYTPRRKDTNKTIEVFPFYRRTDFTRFGTLQNHKSQEFLAKQFDFLLYLVRERNIYTEHVLAASAALCKVGPFENHLVDSLDLMVHYDQTQPEASLETTMLDYIKQLR